MYVLYSAHCIVSFCTVVCLYNILDFFLILFVINVFN